MVKGRVENGVWGRGRAVYHLYLFILISSWFTNGLKGEWQSFVISQAGEFVKALTWFRLHESKMKIR